MVDRRITKGKGGSRQASIYSAQAMDHHTMMQLASRGCRGLLHGLCVFDKEKGDRPGLSYSVRQQG
jgi:hypothetical protein